MSNQLGAEEAAKLDAIEALVASLREDAGPRKGTFGERAADKAASWVGSWTFILTQMTGIVLYMTYNVWLLKTALPAAAFDPYPFILLNLCMSLQAAFTAPIIIMATTRSDAKDRRSAVKAYKTIAGLEEMIKVVAEMKEDHEVEVHVEPAFVSPVAESDDSEAEA